MSSFAYYILDKPIIEDKTFDILAILLKEEWDKVDHQHKTLLSLDQIKAGTCLIENYPSIVKGAVESLYKNSRLLDNDSFNPRSLRTAKKLGSLS